MSFKYLGLALVLASHTAYAVAEIGSCDPPSETVELVTLDAAVVTTKHVTPEQVRWL